jgi:hypothetical protein
MRNACELTTIQWVNRCSLIDSVELLQAVRVRGTGAAAAAAELSGAAQMGMQMNVWRRANGRLQEVARREGNEDGGRERMVQQIEKMVDLLVLFAVCNSELSELSFNFYYWFTTDILASLGASASVCRVSRPVCGLWCDGGCS